MKRFAALILALVLVLALAGSAVAGVPDKPSAFSYAYDFTGKVLSDSDISEIAGYGQALYDATGVQAIAVVVDFLDGADPADYATDIINTWGVGSSTENDGVVVLLARGDRKVQIGTGTGIDRVLTGSRCGKLIDESIDYFANNQFDRGMRALYADVCEYVASAKGKTLSPGGAQTAAATTAQSASAASSAQPASPAPADGRWVWRRLLAWRVWRRRVWRRLLAWRRRLRWRRRLWRRFLPRRRRRQELLIGRPHDSQTAKTGAGHRSLFWPVHR